jgi:sensor histidine kinase regulating citrate/malate metabolism
MNEIRETKHDIRHFIGTMSRFAEEGRFDELKEFLKEYGEKTEMKQLPMFCENVVANSIIGYYYLRANESGIPFESRCNIGRQTTMSDSDICIVLGNALENAVEACRQMNNSETRFVSIEAGAIKVQWLLKVKNSYNGQLEIKDERYISSKKSKSHGLGIRNIEKVAEAYGGFVKIEHDDKEFVLMVAVPEK